MTTYRYDRVARRRPQFLARTEWLKPDWPVVPDAKVAIVPGRSSGVRFSVIIRALKQYVELQQQYPQPPQPPQRYGYNQQPQSPPYGNYQQPAAALPSIWPTLLITFFFGIFGIIPAVMHTTKGKGGRPPDQQLLGNPHKFNCNIAFADGDQLSYWATPTLDGSYTCTRRTH